MKKRHSVYAIVVDGVIRYIGRSNDPPNRLNGHLREARRGLSGLLSRKLAKALRNGAIIRQVILVNGLSRKAAAKREIIEIALHGGHLERGRQLWNTHRGGLGGASLESSKALKKKWATDKKFRKRMSLAAKKQIAAQRKNDPTFEQNRINAVHKERTSKKALKQLAIARTMIDREKQKRAVSQSSKIMWSDPIYRENKIKQLRSRGSTLH